MVYSHQKRQTASKHTPKKGGILLGRKAYFWGANLLIVWGNINHVNNFQILLDIHVKTYKQIL